MKYLFDWSVNKNEIILSIKAIAMWITTIAVGHGNMGKYGECIYGI